GKPAGLRTNLLICVGAALLTELSIAIARMAEPAGFRTADPARLAAQIVSGIGFLGAGTIIQARGSVVGLTTAATLWVVAAIGIAAGSGAYVEAVGTTVLVIIVLILLGRLEGRLLEWRAEADVAIEVLGDAGPDFARRIDEAVTRAGFQAQLLELEQVDGRVRGTFRVIGPRRQLETMMHEVLEIPNVKRISRQ
ncbi:MAG TPA: MgtC/SapB family protein, partial [Longimicrobiales bacterium]|nr:MgtC/SapB family protein [Longimicrobiales bacterium]